MNVLDHEKIKTRLTKAMCVFFGNAVSGNEKNNLELVNQVKKDLVMLREAGVEFQKISDISIWTKFEDHA